MAEEWVLTRGGLKRVAGPQQAEAQLAEDSRPRKRVAASADAEPTAPAAAHPSDAGMNFRSMRQEVESFGAAHLDSKKDKQHFHKRGLQSLGFKAPKQARVGAYADSSCSCSVRKFDQCRAACHQRVFC